VASPASTSRPSAPPRSGGRCLIPADRFYDWKAVGGHKVPYYVRLKSSEPMAFAGPWECWTGPNGEKLETAAIVTTEANWLLAPIHLRMVVIVPPGAFDLWLNTEKVDAKTKVALIQPASENLLEAYEISTAFNCTANEIRNWWNTSCYK
jgi:putative SOS response-associated peptidase YedK